MNLREDKGWSYGAGGGVGSALDRVFYGIRAGVQADRTKDSLAEIRREVSEFTTTRGVQPNEMERIVNSNIRAMPGQFETANDVLGGIVNIVEYGRPDDYYETLAARYQAMTPAQLDAAARANLDEKKMVYVIVGDATVVQPQFEGYDLDIEVRELEQ